MRLWQLFKYEQARGGGINPVAYHINSHAILEDIGYRTEYKGAKGWKGECEGGGGSRRRWPSRPFAMVFS